MLKGGEGTLGVLERDSVLDDLSRVEAGPQVSEIDGVSSATTFDFRIYSS